MEREFTSLGLKLRQLKKKMESIVFTRRTVKESLVVIPQEKRQRIDSDRLKDIKQCLEILKSEILFPGV
jgi:hypothetical protein